VHLPLRLMVASGAGSLSLADVIVRLRCEKCGAPPIRIALEEDAAAASPGRMGACGWKVVLIE
jgi:hypothetical protein